MTDFHDDDADDQDAPTSDHPTHPYDQLDNESAQVMRAVPTHGTVTPEDLAARAGLPLRIVLRRLLLLELADLVHRRDGGVALATGDGHADTPLSDLVSVYCAARPDQPLKPYEIARDLTAALAGRHVGTSAVLDCCLHLAATGRLVQVSDVPNAFAFPNVGMPADDDGNTRS